MSAPTNTNWPPHSRRTVPWRPMGRGGTRADRELRSIAVSIPPRIADAPMPDLAHLTTDIDAAMREISLLDGGHAEVLAPLAPLLLRTESVASSKIERLVTSLDDYARAEHGIRANPVATEMVAGTHATAHLVGSVIPGKSLELNEILTAHRALMTDPAEQPGRIRSVQNWIGGSDHSPRNAMYVPPPPDEAVRAMHDLLIFANRADGAALVQAAIVHAQFESIHPFVDGNGRIGRALVNAVLRRRGTTRSVVLPIASALVAHRDRYFDALTTYRDGDPEPIATEFVKGALVAATEARTTAATLSSAPGQWGEQLGRLRKDSVTARMLPMLLAHPVITADDVTSRTGASPANVYGAISRLVEAEVLRPLTDRKRNQVWGVTLVLDEIEDLGARIAKAVK